MGISFNRKEFDAWGALPGEPLEEDPLALATGEETQPDDSATSVPIEVTTVSPSSLLGALAPETVTPEAAQKKPSYDSEDELPPEVRENLIALGLLDPRDGA